MGGAKPLLAAIFVDTVTRADPVWLTGCKATEGGATAGQSLQVSSLCHQFMWQWSLLRHRCLQDLHAWVPWCSLGHQDQQGWLGVLHGLMSLVASVSPPLPLQSAEGAHLSWEPPANSAGTITEYSVYLGLKPQPGAQPGTMAFARVYCGPGSSCVVSHHQLASAHVDTTSKPAIIFRIAAKNDKG